MDKTKLPKQKNATMETGNTLTDPATQDEKLDLKAIVTFTLSFVLSVLLVISSLFTWLAFHIDMTKIEIGTPLTDTPNKMVAWLLMGLTILLFILTTMMFLKIFKTDFSKNMKTTHFLKKNIGFVSFCVGSLAFANNLYGIKEYFLGNEFYRDINNLIVLYPYSLKLFLKNENILSPLLLSKFNLFGMRHIFIWFNLIVIILTPGIAFLLVRLNDIPKPQSQIKAIVFALLKIILIFLFPFLVILFAIQIWRPNVNKLFLTAIELIFCLSSIYFLRQIFTLVKYGETNLLSAMLTFGPLSLIFIGSIAEYRNKKWGHNTGIIGLLLFVLSVLISQVYFLNPILLMAFSFGLALLKIFNDRRMDEYGKSNVI